MEIYQISIVQYQLYIPDTSAKKKAKKRENKVGFQKFPPKWHHIQSITTVNSKIYLTKKRKENKKWFSKVPSKMTPYFAKGTYSVNKINSKFKNIPDKKKEGKQKMIFKRLPPKMRTYFAKGYC